MDALDRGSLKIGDLITLRTLKFDSFLFAEGILLEDVGISNDLSRFDDCIFCIHLQRQYSAAKELAAFYETYNLNSDSKIDNPALQQYHEALKRGQSNENRLNDDYFTKKTGKVVLFGDIIQLYHVKSGKYLTMTPSMLAVEERENLRITLDAAGNTMSWIQLLPRFKIDKEGDRIPTGTELYLKILERGNEYVHCADRHFQARRNREVNSSLELTSWKLNIFESTTDSMDKTFLMGGQIIYIYDPETRCALSLEKPSADNIDISTDEYPEDYCPGVILSPVHETYVDSNFLWYVESITLVDGGSILWKTDQVRFKNFNSGWYLIQDIQENNGSEVVVRYATSRSPADPRTLFSVREVNSAFTALRVEKPVQIVASNYYLARSSVRDDLTFEVQGIRDSNFALNFLLYRFFGGQEKDDTADQYSSICEPWDIYSASATKFYFQKFLKLTTFPQSRSVSSLWPNGDKDIFEYLQSFMTQVTYFSQGFSISETNIVLGVDKAETHLRIRRQHLLRETGVLEIVLRYISKLIPVSNVTNNGSKREKESLSEVIEMGNALLHLCFNIIFYCIQDNSDNQMYVADFMPVLLSHLGTAQPLASKCVTEMLSNNMELQETKIGSREIAIFVEKLRGSKMGALYLNLLQSCCSCQGNGVDNNQCKVAEMLFSDANDIMIQLHADYNNLTPYDWGTSIFLPDKGASDILGASLLKSGLPKLTITWSDKVKELSPMALFGKKEVDLENVFPLTIVQQKSSTRRESMQSFRSTRVAEKHSNKLVFEYFIAEMFLGAEMCMDRNYVAMHLLDPLFPYDSLVAILRMDVDTRLKSAAVRLLMCLYVDRDPQASTKVPCYTRTWSEISKNPIPRLPYVETSRQNMFALIQQLISIHIEQMIGNRWEEYSQHMLRMLLTLVNFNFYGTTEKLNDIIGPLIQVLDRRKVEFDVSYTSKAAKSNTIDNSAEEKKEETESIPWQKTTLDFLESIPVLLSVLGLVFVAVGLTIYQTITGANDGPGSWFYVTGLVILCIFCIEVTSRFYCYVYVRHEVLSFIMDGFNQIDISVILLDIVFYCLPSNIGGGGGKYTKVLRLARLLRLLRVLRAARVVNKLANYEEIKEEWKPPIRYTKAPIHELETMVAAINVLAYCQQVIEDRNISLMLRKFYSWESGEDKQSPVEIFNKVIEDSKELSLGIYDFDLVMIDVLMFVNETLVQGCLELLMAHHSLRRTLLDNMNEVQLLVSTKREQQYKLVDQMLQQLERNAETHELWGELESDADHATNKQTTDILVELTEICRYRRFVLEFDEEYAPDVEMQNLFRNLGCFSISMKVLGLLDSVEEDENGEFDDVAKNTKNLCALCNELLYWFFLGNAKNQELGYDELDFFLESLDDGIGSHRVIHSLFFMNEALMKRVPHSMLNDMVEKIIKNGRKPAYLALFSSICYVGEKNLPENQLQIAISLGSPAHLPQVGSFLVSVDHEDYRHKQALMAPYLQARNVNIDELPEELCYHIRLLEVFSNCTIGRLNITTVEAKIQSIFSYVDIINAMIDPACMLLVKIKLGMHLLNAMIEVEMKLPGLESSGALWNLLKSFSHPLQFAKDDLRSVEKHGWESPDINRQHVEYIMVCVYIIRSFFKRYYDAAALRHDDGTSSADRVTLSLQQVNQLINIFFYSIKDVYDMDCPRLSKKHKTALYEAMVALNNSASSVIVTSIEQTHLVDHEEIDKAEDISQEAVVLRKYASFMEELRKSEEIQTQTNNESLNFIAVMENLPYLSDPMPADIRYETFIKKLVSHVRENFKYVNGERRLDPRVAKTTTWIIKSFRTMIENRMGMSIYDRDEDGGEEQDEAAAPVVSALNICGATTLCLDLVAVGIDEVLQAEAIKLAVAVLFKEGGALEVQELMHNHLSKNPSDLFFRQVRLTLQKLIAWHKWHGIIELKEGEELDLPDDVIIVRFLQLMCEGHYLSNQDILREQPHNEVSVNLLDDFVTYLNILSRIPCRTSTCAAIRVGATILEVIQGPCRGNQVHFALDTELIETLNRVLRSKVVRDCVDDEVLELRATGVDILQGLLEGQGAKSVVYERVLSVIHLDVIQVLSKPPEVEVIDEEGNVKMVPAEVSEEEEVLQTEAMVLLQMFCDYRPSLHDELGVSRKVEDIVGSGTACIEVFWRGELHRRFFHIPAICSDLAKTTRDKFVENVDRSSIENKLLNFLDSAQDMYREVKHQQVLKSLKLSGVFSPKNQDRVTWATFSIAILINIFFLSWYDASSGTPAISMSRTQAINAFNFLQSILAVFTLIQYLVVKTPVIYQSFEAKGLSVWEAALATSMDDMTVYYFIYLTFSLLGILVADYYLTFLLLDIIVKNSTTRDVLNAVVLPRKQLGMALILGLFILYIFTFFLFFYFQSDMGDVCSSMWKCVKYVFCYGLRQGGGIGDLLPLTVLSRWLIDTLFFIVVTIMLLNIIFGIIIDTFSSLRSDKLDRLADTTGICFVCGIDELTFERASKEPDGFQRHLKLDHNMWSYLYFIFHLWEQDKDDDDGLELYVRKAIEANEIFWFPMNKAMCLTMAASEMEELQENMLKEIESSEDKIEMALSEIRQEIKYDLDQIVKALKVEYGKGNMKNGISTYFRELDQKSHVGRKMAVSEIYPDDISLGMSEVERKMMLGSNIFVTILEMKGFDLKFDNVGHLSCRIISDSAIYTQPALDLENDVIIFDKNSRFLICENAQLNDPRNCQFQALLGSTNAPAKCIGVFEISCDAILRSSQMILEGKLVSQDEGSECGVIKIEMKVKDAKKFRGQSDADLDSEVGSLSVG